MKKAIALAPADASYHRKIAAMLMSLDRYSESRGHWIEATNFEPGNPRNFVKLAEVCLLLDLRAEAVQALAEAQRLAPNDPNVLAVADRMRGLVPEGKRGAAQTP